MGDFGKIAGKGEGRVFQDILVIRSRQPCSGHGAWAAESSHDFLFLVLNSGGIGIIAMVMEGDIGR